MIIIWLLFPSPNRILSQRRLFHVVRFKKINTLWDCWVVTFWMENHILQLKYIDRNLWIYLGLFLFQPRSLPLGRDSHLRAVEMEWWINKCFLIHTQLILCRISNLQYWGRPQRVSGCLEGLGQNYCSPLARHSVNLFLEAVRWIWTSRMDFHFIPFALIRYSILMVRINSHSRRRQSIQNNWIKWSQSESVSSSG